MALSLVKASGRRVGLDRWSFKGKFGEMFFEKAVGPLYLTRRLGVIWDMEFPGNI